GYFGARLVQGGADVSFLARGKHLAAIREKGLTIESPQGNVRLKVKVFEDPAEAGQVDAVMFAVKLWDTEAAATQIKPIIGKRTVVIPLQNGVESIDALRKLLPASAVMGGSAYIATRVREPGVIEHTGNMARLQFGALLASQHNAADAFLAACRQAGLNAELCEDIVRANWEKFVFLVGVSSATAATRKPLGTVRADADMRWLFEQTMRETWHLARKRGVELPDDFVESRLAFADTLHTEMRASLLHDLEAGHRLEAPWLCGAVARMSAQAGLDAPVNRAIFAALKPYVNGR
ncbi:MAG TPA: 2-dehydropantoate 2-reductase, partial [Burkholderiales bacterium]|nr:2-dehydropantoate 2-reductase [Burkholderiales bacterium]